MSSVFDMISMEWPASMFKWMPVASKEKNWTFLGTKGHCWRGFSLQSVLSLMKWAWTLSQLGSRHQWLGLNQQKMRWDGKQVCVIWHTKDICAAWESNEPEKFWCLSAICDQSSRKLWNRWFSHDIWECCCTFDRTVRTCSAVLQSLVCCFVPFMSILEWCCVLTNVAWSHIALVCLAHSATVGPKLSCKRRIARSNLSLIHSALWWGCNVKIFKASFTVTMNEDIVQRLSVQRINQWCNPTKLNANVKFGCAVTVLLRRWIFF